jgi:hypothetical protein
MRLHKAVSEHLCSGKGMNIIFPLEVADQIADFLVPI